MEEGRMYVEVVAAKPEPELVLRDASNFSSLALKVPQQVSSAELAGLLSRLGWGQLSDNDHATLWVSRLRDETGVGAEPGLVGKFDAMIGYAQSQGWMSADGAGVAAHIEWT